MKTLKILFLLSVFVSMVLFILSGFYIYNSYKYGWFLDVGKNVANFNFDYYRSFFIKYDKLAKIYSVLTGFSILLVVFLGRRFFLSTQKKH